MVNPAPFDPIQKFLLRAKGSLTALQSVDLTLYAPSSLDAKNQLAIFVREAEKGDEYAITTCAACFRSGWGAKIDFDQAFMWAKKAAATGFAPGIAELGICYETGNGIDKNLDLAASYLHESARLGYAMAACHLALQYSNEEPYGYQPEKAMEYAVMASQLGEGYAAYLLGTWYEEGKLIEKNNMLARVWYKKSAEQGSGLGCIRMVVAFTLGELGCSRDLNEAAKYEKLTESMNSP